MDYVGPLPTESGGIHYLLVMIDMFSRFREVYPCCNLTTETLIKKRHFMTRFGLPDAVLSDLPKFGIKKLRTLYQPRDNGWCERFNDTMHNDLKALLNQERKQRTSGNI